VALASWRSHRKHGCLGTELEHVLGLVVQVTAHLWAKSVGVRLQYARSLGYVNKDFSCFMNEYTKVQRY
jgi:hypothetical protein